MNAMEKLLYGGPEMLTNKELLGLVLRSGSGDKTATDLAGDILDSFGNDFCGAEVRELMEVYGVGEAKAASVVSAMALSRRMSISNNVDRMRFCDSESAAELLMEDMRDLPQEHFVCLYLDTKLKLIKRVTVGIGTLDSALVHPRDVYRQAVKTTAAAIIAAHNHPSGDPTPSPQDVTLTKRLVEAGEVMGINLIDHIIIGDGCYTSMRNEGHIEV